MMNVFDPNPVWLASMALAYEAHSVKDAVPDAPAYPTTRREYVSSVGLAVSGYLELGSIRHRNAMKRVVSNKFPDAFYRGYSEVGGEDTEDEDEDWLADKTSAELEYVDTLFVSLKELRASGREYDVDEVADEHAEGYAATLDAVYAEGKLRGDRNKMYEFDGDDGEESCRDCTRLKGKRMKARKIIAEGLIPSPGNDNFECKGYKCQHGWKDDKGNWLVG